MKKSLTKFRILTLLSFYCLLGHVGYSQSQTTEAVAVEAQNDLASPISMSSTPSLSAGIALDADRIFTHPSEDNQTKDLTLAKGTYTFEVDADPNSYHCVDWYNTNSGGSPVETAFLYYYDDTDFNLTASGWVRAEIYQSDLFNNRYAWEASYRWNVTISTTSTPTPTPTRTPTSTSTPTATRTPTSTPTQTSTGNFTSTPTPSPTVDPRTDINQDGVINDEDLLLLLKNWNRTL